MKVYTTLFFTSLLYLPLAAQSITDSELSVLADLLVQKANDQLGNQNIAIADFVDVNDEPSDLGKYLAEEFTYTLVEKTTQFKVIDRTHLRQLMKEAGLGDKGMTDPASVQKLGRLEGITAILYGKLIPTSNKIRVYVKVILLEGQVNELTVRGMLTRTPTIDGFMSLGGEKQGVQMQSSTSPSPTPTPSFVNSNIHIQVNSCTRKGSIVDCELEITSNGRNDNFVLKTDKSRLVDSRWNSYPATILSMNGRQSAHQLNQPLAANQPIPALVRFSNVPTSLSSAERLEFNCTSLVAFSFTAQFENIIIQ